MHWLSSAHTAGKYLQHPEPQHRSCRTADTAAHEPPAHLWEALPSVPVHPSPTETPHTCCHGEGPNDGVSLRDRKPSQTSVLNTESNWKVKTITLHCWGQTHSLLLFLLPSWYLIKCSLTVKGAAYTPAADRIFIPSGGMRLVRKTFMSLPAACITPQRSRRYVAASGQTCVQTAANTVLTFSVVHELQFKRSFTRTRKYANCACVEL